jgi:PKD repeat protein
VAGQAVQFTDTSTGSPTSWQWSFGDGTTSSVQNPGHIFVAAGSFTVMLVVNNTSGSNSATRVIAVSPAASLTAAFTYSPVAPVVGQAVQFTDTSTGNPTSWQWNFGDGMTNSVQYPSHIFTTTGSKTVTLTVSNGTGSNIATRTVSVLDASGILPPDRQIDWSRAGVWENGVKGIPNRTVVFCNVRVSIPGSSLVARGDGAQDDRAALQAAINACPVGQVVYIPQGTYRVSGAITINKGIVVRGQVDGNNTPLTEVVQYASLGQNYGTFHLTGVSAYPYQGVDVVSGYGKGSTALVVSNASTFMVNDIVTLDELNNPDLVTNAGRLGDSGTLNPCDYAGRTDGSTRAFGETFLITAKSGNTLTINRPLYWNFQAQYQPQLYRHSETPLYHAGVENIHIRTAAGPSDGQGVLFMHCAYCWVKNCEMESSPRRGIALRYGVYGCEVRHNYIHNHSTDSFSQDNRYGIFIYSNSDDNLIEDNIVYYTLAGLVFEVGCSGNVIAYNYFNTTRLGSQEWKTADVCTHAPHPYMNLYEGNVLGMLAFDVYHGSASHQVVYRNWMHTQNPDWFVNQARMAIGCDGWNRYCSFVGNVLGYPNMVALEAPWPVYYEQLPSTGDYERVDIWKVGLWCNADGTPEANGDPLTVSTAIRHGNYDYVRNQTEWSSSISEHTLPNSLYLTSKPAWFGSMAWPAIGPDATPMNGTTPAKWRFENSLYFANAR